ncbi:MAG TPA: tetratricopeptide repeat protein, partial [candidate division Zixibacteria bacterium]|nr:tetratricopeptide repeat protein [candidate division Zixibacteria bacterium]
PENVLVTSKHHVKITDFGLAKWKGASTLTQTGARMGTAYYMSPEQVEGKKVDYRTDIFSLGVILYELLCVRRPFEGDTDTAVFYELLNVRPQPLARYCRDLPERLEPIVLKCLAKKPKERYQHADELLVDLRTVKRGLETDALEAPSARITAYPSIAVLPFVNLSPDPENEYFSDGLTEEVIANLTKVRALKVISRTSIMRYKNIQKPLKQIAGELGVQYILEGSVRKHGADLRITAQLIDAAQDAHLWAEKYGGTIEQVFEIQEKVAEKIVEALQLRLSPSEREGLKKRYTDSPELYQLYLQGRYYWKKRTVDGFNKSIKLFQQAIEKDPHYAVAYAGLADSYAFLGEAGTSAIPPKIAFSQARTAVTKALELDGSLAEARASLGHLLMHEFDWSGAEREFKRAIQLNPNYATAYQWYAVYLAVLGRWDEAMEAIEQANQLDPVSLSANNSIATLYLLARRFDKAVEHYRKTLEMDPNYAFTYSGLAETYSQMGRHQEAIAMIGKAIELLQDRTKIARLGFVYAKAGKKEEALKIVEELKTMSQQQYISPFEIAEIYATLDEKETAFAWLQKAFEDGVGDLIYLKVEPWLDNLRSDARFTGLLRKAGLEK